MIVQLWQLHVCLKKQVWFLAKKPLHLVENPWCFANINFVTILVALVTPPENQNMEAEKMDLWKRRVGPALEITLFGLEGTKLLDGWSLHRVVEIQDLGVPTTTNPRREGQS